MKSKLLIVSLALVSLAVASAPTKVLLVHKDGTKPAKVIVGEMTITADSITHETTANHLRCTGSVQIRSGASVVKAPECTIELDAGSRVYRLDPAGVRLESNQASAPTATAVTPPATQEARQK